MKRVLFIVCCLGFSLEGMKPEVKQAPRQVSPKHEQAFWAVVAAIDAGDLEKAKALVSATPDIVRCCDGQKRTLLHISIEKKCTSFSLWLISLPNCKLDSRDDKQHTPLLLATFLRDSEVAAELVKRGIALDIPLPKSSKDSLGVGTKLLSAVFSKKNTVLHDAVEKADQNIKELVGQHRSLIDKQNAEGDTPLHLAVARKDEVIVEFLVNEGARIDVANALGRTPLHLASAGESMVLCSLLLKRIESLQVSSVQRMLLQPERAQDGTAAQALLLLSDERNYTRHKEELIAITNDTTWRLLLRFVYLFMEPNGEGIAVEKAGELIIEPGDQLLFYGMLANLKSMHVSLYGKNFQCLQWGEPLDLFAAWQEEIKQWPGYTVEIKIIGEKGRIWQYLSRFNIKSFGNGSEFYQPASRVSPNGFVADAFPCVRSSRERQKVISARNFLQISSTASAEAAKLAFQQLDTLWKRQLTITNKAYVDQVRKLLKQAYDEVLAKMQMSEEEKAAQKPGLAFLFNNLQRIFPLEVSGPTSKPACECLLALYNHMGTITPEILDLFLKKFRREELVRLLRMQDGSGQTAAYLALAKSNNQLYTYLLLQERGKDF